MEKFRATVIPTERSLTIATPQQKQEVVVFVPLSKRLAQVVKEMGVDDCDPRTRYVQEEQNKRGTYIGAIGDDI